MRVDVDFNQRDRRGRVIAQVPFGDQAARLVPGSPVYLYDPIERLWAEATVASINEEARVAAFDVDWHSFADAEVADLTIGHRRWFLGLPPGEHHWLPSFVFVENVSQLTFSLRMTLTLPGEHGETRCPLANNSTAGTQVMAVTS